MKYRSLLILFSLIIFKTVCQENDSTFFNKFSDREGVQTVKYLKGFFNNGNLKYEGWAIYKDTPGYEYEEFKIGLWKMYYKNSNVKSIYHYGQKIADTTKRKDFNKKGMLVYESTYYVKSNVDSESYKNVIKSNAKLKDDKWRVFTYYNKYGPYLKGQYISGKTKNGKWFFYKKGELKKVKYYNDGKLIETKRIEN